MRLLIIVFLLLTTNQVIAQDNPTTPSAKLIIGESLNASESATTSAQEDIVEAATPPAEIQESPKLESTSSAIIDKETTQMALIYTGIVMLILFAFIAGKKSSELDRSDK